MLAYTNKRSSKRPKERYRWDLPRCSFGCSSAFHWSINVRPKREHYVSRSPSGSPCPACLRGSDLLEQPFVANFRVADRPNGIGHIPVTGLFEPDLSTLPRFCGRVPLTASIVALRKGK